MMAQGRICFAHGERTAQQRTPRMKEILWRYRRIPLLMAKWSSEYTTLQRLAPMLKFYSTIGAGDTFIAGVLYGLFHSSTWDLAKTLSFANELAGRKVAQHGFSGLSETMGPWLDPP